MFLSLASFVSLLSVLYARTHTLPVVVSAFSGLQAVVVAIVAHAAFVFGKTWLKEWKRLLIVLDLGM